jgi:hypothetical protein
MSIKPKWIYVAVGLLSVLIYMVGFSGIGGSAAEAFGHLHLPLAKFAEG